MYVVSKASDNYRLAFKFIARTSQIGMQLFFNRRLYPRLPVLSAEDNVDVVLY